jgi:hypothetical protein
MCQETELFHLIFFMSKKSSKLFRQIVLLVFESKEKTFPEFRFI